MSQPTVKKNISFFTFLSTIQLALALFCVILLGTLAYFQAAHFLDQEMGSRLQCIAEAGVLLVDGDQLAALNTGDENSSEYQEIFNRLHQLKIKTSATYIYTMRLLDGKPAYVVDADPSSDRNPINKIYADFEPEMKSAFNGKTTVNPKAAKDKDTKIWSRSGYAPIKNSVGEIVGIVGVDLSQKQIDNEKNGLLGSLFLIGFLVVGIAGLVASLSARRLFRPLKVLMNRLNQIASSKGDLTQKIKVDTFIIEIAELAETVNRVQDNTRSTLKGISRLIGTLNSATGRLLDSTHTVSASSEEVSAMMDEIEQGAVKQSASSTNIAEVMTGIAKDSTEAAVSVAEAENISVISAEAAEKGQASVQETLSILVQVQNYAAKLKDLSIDLNTRSMQIRKMLELLTYISRQTKILSLNANIEASKAGKAGQGFAVVALQIRELADNSQNSVDEISAQVSEVRNALSETVSLVHTFYELVEKSGGKILEAETSLVEIQEKSKENLTFVNQVSTLVKQQVGKTTDATEYTQMIAEISNTFVNSSQTVVAAVEEQAQAMQSILAVGEDIRLAVSELQRMVEECKLD